MGINIVISLAHLWQEESGESSARHVFEAFNFFPSMKFNANQQISYKDCAKDGTTGFSIW